MKGMLNKKTLTLLSLLLFLTLLVGCFPLINQSPIITSTPITLAEVNELYTYEVEATDPDGDLLTYSLEVKPSGMTIISATGLIKWIPTTKGDYAVVVKVTDGTLDITQSFTIVVSEAEEPGWTPTGTPIITSNPITIATVGVTYFYDVEATDPNGDTLTYSLTTYQSGMTISSASGLIMWTPTTAQVGNNLVTVMVSDGFLSDTQGFNIVVSKPTVPLETYTITASAGTGGFISPLGDVTVDEGSDISFNITPNALHVVEKVLVDGSSVGAVSTYPFINVAKDHTIYAAFSAIEPEPDVELTGIEVSPDILDLLKEDSKQLTVTAIYSDVSTLDVTSDCVFQSNDIDIASVNATGIVTANAFGRATITVSYREEITRTTYIEETDAVEVTVIGPVQNIDTSGYYDTIQAAIVSASAGNTIEVMAGTYNEQVTIDKQLILNGANASVSIIDGEDSAAIIISADGVSIDGFTLDGGITLDDSANSISGGTISNNIITGADESVWPVKAENGIMLGWDDGIGVDYITIENNIIKNSRCKGIRFANPKLGNGGGTSSYITIHNNEIKDNGSAGMETYGPGPNFITDNTISGNDGNGINLKFDDGDIVTGNIITNNTGPGITLRQVSNSIVENNRISGHRSENMFKNSDVIGGKGSGIQIIMVSEGNTIRFNDISENNYGIFIRKKNDLQPSDNSINYNNIVGNIYYGILNDLVDSLIPVDAIDNWWGDASGPSGFVNDPVTGETANGSGNAVSIDVFFDPWLLSENPH